MKNKTKGSNAERELLLKLYKNGFAVSRVAGSGSSTLPTPDIIAVKNKKGFAIECKTKSGEYLNIKETQIKELEIWENLSGFKSYIAWRLGKENWYFLYYKKMNKTKIAYSIKKSEIIEKGINFSNFIKSL
ncbi:MAG: Holliday junction resolvase Hjc [Candidatus ainarchaeum sp.]|nr:Holliday junction resolvase Hjc [Candidatus ainarchaeum sp.]MDD3976174.1 Holliday junction resolvase Hjc [Candidatus ainarchaeum sp.]